MRGRIFAIRSSSSDRGLGFPARGCDAFRIELPGRGLDAAGGESACTDSKTLALFEHPAAHVRPWQGAESGSLLEGELALSATSATRGHIHFRVEPWRQPGAPEEWRASAGITSEMGQLRSMAVAAHPFFDDAHA